MARKQKSSIKAEYDKIRISGHQPYGHRDKPYIYIGVKDMSYGIGEAASAVFTVEEAEEIIGLLKLAIKQASKKEKN